MAGLLRDEGKYIEPAVKHWDVHLMWWQTNWRKYFLMTAAW